MAHATAEERDPARMPTAVNNRVVEVAQALGATLNQFLVQSTLETANGIIERERSIKLSTASSKLVFDLVENPPAPNGRLTAAMKRRQDFLCSKELPDQRSISPHPSVMDLPVSQSTH